MKKAIRIDETPYKAAEKQGAIGFPELCIDLYLHSSFVIMELNRGDDLDEYFFRKSSQVMVARALYPDDKVLGNSGLEPNVQFS